MGNIVKSDHCFNMGWMLKAQGRVCGGWIHTAVSDRNRQAYAQRVKPGMKSDELLLLSTPEKSSMQSISSTSISCTGSITADYNTAIKPPIIFGHVNINAL